MGAAPLSIRLWLLLCSDLAIRSGTAHKLNGRNYDPFQGVLRFKTKAQAHQTLPVTAEIRAIINPLDHTTATPYVWQLRAQERHIGGHNAKTFYRHSLDKELHRLRAALGISKRIIPHDLRRTTAVAVMEETKDIRVVKALLGHSDLKTTLWYLDHDMTPVDIQLLETIKQPKATPETKTA
jgi:site-specific recombinase XerD